jgi:hypothetical protein
LTRRVSASTRPCSADLPILTLEQANVVLRRFVKGQAEEGGHIDLHQVEKGDTEVQVAVLAVEHLPTCGQSPNKLFSEWAYLVPWDVLFPREVEERPLDLLYLLKDSSLPFLEGCPVAGLRL